jgi:hypothetical protein
MDAFNRAPATVYRRMSAVMVPGKQVSMKPAQGRSRPHTNPRLVAV